MRGAAVGMSSTLAAQFAGILIEASRVALPKVILKFASTDNLSLKARIEIQSDKDATKRPTMTERIRAAKTLENVRKADGDGEYENSTRKRGFLLAGFAGLFLLISPSCHAESVAFDTGMVCGANIPRPDHNHTLHEQIAHTAHGTIGYYKFGQGSPIVLITGFRATISEWNAYFLGGLAQSHEIVVFDNRNIGKSSSSRTNYGIQDLSHDTLVLIKTLGLKNVTLLGWSMGGMAAQQLALNHPPEIARLILLSTAPPGRDAIPLSPYVEQLLSGGKGASFDNIMDVLFPPDTQDQAKKCFVQDMFKPSGYAAPKIPQNVTTAQQIILRNWQSDNQLLEHLRSLDLPTLILVGENDAVLPPENAVRLNHLIPHSRLIEVHDGGHAMMYQYPVQLSHLIDNYLEVGN
jgi:pimeloyl-ACP methyl ester carboxylesterase